VFARWRQRAKPVKGGIERIIVDFVVVRSRSNSENLNISIQTFSGSLSVKDFKMALRRKSEIGLEIERSDTSFDRVRHA